MQSDYKEITETTNINYSLLCGKTVLITGGNGLIAKYLINFLIYLNEHVFSTPVIIYVLCRDLNQTNINYGKYLKRKYFHLKIQDVCQEVNCEPDFIFHLASGASSKQFAKDPIAILDANIAGTRNMLLLAHRANSKMIFLSSGEVYGQNAHIPTSETDYGYIDLSNTRSVYAESKRCAEMFCICASRQLLIDVKIIRPFHTYGPGMDLENDDRVFASFVKNVIQNENILLHSNGNAIRCFLYLQDFIEGFFTVLFKGKTAEAYNVASYVPVKIAELAHILVELFPEKNLHVAYKPEVSFYKQSLIDKNHANINKVMKLGWEPKIDIGTGFKRTINSYIGKGK